MTIRTHKRCPSGYGHLDTGWWRGGAWAAAARGDMRLTGEAYRHIHCQGRQWRQGRIVYPSVSIDMTL